MIPIKVTFKSGQFITAYSSDPDSFAQTVADVSPPEIIGIDYEFDVATNIPELQEVTLTLQSGALILCKIPKTEVIKIPRITEVADFAETATIAYARMAAEEAVLDERFKAACLVINNIPILSIRSELHKEYLKRKAAYVAALEALVDSVIRRPKE
jgi:hypothetical protein